MPLPILLAHKIMKQYEIYRKTTSEFFADAKCQVSVEYENDKPVNIEKIKLNKMFLNLHYMNTRNLF